jgi:hypothetical protein
MGDYPKAEPLYLEALQIEVLSNVVYGVAAHP